MANVLIVDDDDAVRGILLELLGNQYECNTASTAEEAFQYLEIQSYDAVLTDLAMPGLTGVELLKRIQLKDLDTPVIFISGKRGEQDPEALIKLGAFAYVSKPFSLDEIEILVERAVQFYQRAHNLSNEQKSDEPLIGESFPQNRSQHSPN